MSRPPPAVALMLTTPGWRGSATSFLKIAAGLRREGFPVTVIVGDADVARRFEAADGAPVALVPTGDTGRREVGAVRRLLGLHRVTFVLADAPRDVRIARYASLLTRRRIAWRYNLSTRDVPPDPLQRFLFGGLAAVVQQSAFGARRLAEGMPWCRPRRQASIPNGYDTDLLAPDPVGAARARERLGLAADQALVLTVGSLIAAKAAAQVPQALAGLRATWLVAGEGPERDALAASATRLGVATVFLGELPVDGLRDVMRAADLVVQPSPAELFPNAIAEAMALGRCVIGPWSGAAPEVIGDAGVVVPSGDPAMLRDAVRGLLADPARAARLGAAARARIVREFPLRRMEEGYALLVKGEG